MSHALEDLRRFMIACDNPPTLSSMEQQQQQQPNQQRKASTAAVAWSDTLKAVGEQLYAYEVNSAEFEELARSLDDL